MLRPELCRVLADPTSTDEIGTALADAATTATDLLLVYYVGHGAGGRPRPAAPGARAHPPASRPVDRAATRSAPEEIVTSAAAPRVLVLDCCFSGRAIDTVADNQAVISGQLDVTGTYAHLHDRRLARPAGDRYTTFTGALLGALDQTDPLTLDQIYVAVDRDLAARNLPRPHSRPTACRATIKMRRRELE